MLRAGTGDLPVSQVRAWLIEQIRFYRRLGFFGEFRRLAEPALAERLSAMQTQLTGEDFDPDLPAAELSVLRWDRWRVWSEEPSLEIEQGQGAYVKILQGLAAISRGCLPLTEATEEWESEEGPIFLHAYVDGVEFASQAIKDGNLFDLEVIKDLNHILIHPYYRFEIAEGDDASASVIVLTPEEKAIIHRSRNLHFHVNELAGMFQACGLASGGVAPPRTGLRVNYTGVFKDEYERALGKLTLSIEDTRVMGRYLVSVEEIQQELNLTGYYDPASQSISGTLLGLSRREQTMESYLGTWKGSVSKGAQAVFGTWVGWYTADARAGGEHRTFSGTFGALDEGVVRVGASDPYLRKLAQWLRQVWEAQTVGDSPLTLV